MVELLVLLAVEVEPEQVEAHLVVVSQQVVIQML